MLSNRLSLFVALSLVLANGSICAYAVAGGTAGFQDTAASSMLPGATNGAPVMESLIQHVNDMGPYKFEGTCNALKGKKIVKAGGIFYFKPQNEIRVEVKDYGAKSGSVLVKRGDGKVVAKGGPQMFGFKMTLSADSRLVQMPNGVSAVECDLLSLCNRVKRELASKHGKFISTDHPIKVGSLSTPVIVLEGQVPGQTGPEITTRVFIDPAQKLPIQWDIFDNGQFTSRCSFKGYQAKAHFDDSQFNL